MDINSTYTLSNIFTETAEKYYNDKVTEIAFKISKYGTITAQSTSEQLTKLTDTVFDALWNWPSIKLDRDNIEPEHEHIAYPIETASKLIGNGFSFSPSNTTSSLLVVKYLVPFTGNANALQYSVNYPKRTFNGGCNKSSIELYFFFQKSLAEIVDDVKNSRDRLLNVIEENQNEFDTHMQSKQDLFKAKISLKIDQLFEEAVRKDKGNDSLR